MSEKKNLYNVKRTLKLAKFNNMLDLAKNTIGHILFLYAFSANLMGFFFQNSIINPHSTSIQSS